MAIDLKIEKIAYGGDGIGFVDGKACFVAGVLPGERVRVEVTQEKKDFIRARVAEVLDASASRVSAPCPYFSTCGGCQYQMMAYDEELRVKEAQVREALSRLPDADKTVFRPIVASAKDYRYRNSVTLHATAGAGNKAQRLGFVTVDNVTKIAVQDCLLVDERLHGAFVEKFTLRGVDRVTFKLSVSGEGLTDLDEKFFRVSVGGQDFVAASRGFFQNNLDVTQKAAGVVTAWVRAFRPLNFYDLYAGVGVFSFLCAGEVENVICVEESKPSVEALRMNKSERRRLRLEVFEGRVEKIFPVLWKKEKKERAMLFLDPPRQGLAFGFSRFLASERGIGAIGYLSCDLATLARDLKILLSEGAYALEEVVPLDMFPRTKHIEAAVLLKGTGAC